MFNGNIYDSRYSYIPTIQYAFFNSGTI